MLVINNIEVKKSDLEHISTILERTINNIKNNKAEENLYQLETVHENLDKNLKEDKNE